MQISSRWVDRGLLSNDGYVMRVLIWVALTLGCIATLFAASRGVAHLVVIVLIAATIVAVFRPMVLLCTPLLLSPLLGRASEWTIGPLDSMAILGLWFLAVCAVVGPFYLGKLRLDRVLWIPFLLPCLAFLSIVQSTAKFTSLAETIRIASAVIMLPLAYLLCRGAKQRTMVFWAMIASTIIPLCVGIYQKITENVDHGIRETTFEKVSDLVRIYATFWDVHPYAKYLMILCSLLFVFFWVERKSMSLKVAYMTFFYWCFLELVFTYARSELIGVFIAFAAILFALGKLQIKKLIIFIPFVLILFYVTGLFERFADLLKGINVSGTAGEMRTNSMESRIIIWSKGFPLALQTPFLGHGANTFTAAVGILSHNDYLGLFYDVGLGGPLVYGLFLYFAAKRTLTCCRFKGLSDFEQNLSLVAFGCTVAIAVVSCVENLYTSTFLWWFYFTILGQVLYIHDEHMRNMRNAEVRDGSVGITSNSRMRGRCSRIGRWLNGWFGARGARVSRAAVSGEPAGSGDYTVSG